MCDMATIVGGVHDHCLVLITVEPLLTLSPVDSCSHKAHINLYGVFILGVNIKYRIAGKFGGGLADLRANRQIKIRQYFCVMSLRSSVGGVWRSKVRRDSDMALFKYFSRVPTLLVDVKSSNTAFDCQFHCSAK